MTTNRPTGPKGGQRTPMGLRIEAYTKKKEWHQKQLAVAIGVQPTKLNDMLAGRHSLGIGMLKRIAGALDNCTVADLLDDGVLTKWVGIRRRFVDTLSSLVDRPWYFFDDPNWSYLLSEACLPHAKSCFDELLDAIGSYTHIGNFMDIGRVLGESIIFIERAYLKHAPDAGQLLFDACDRMVQGLNHTLAPVALKIAADPYLAKMARVFEDTQDPALGPRLWDREGDVLKIYSEYDTSALTQAEEVLRRGLSTGRGPDFHRIGYHSIRSRVIVGAKTAIATEEFFALLDMAERALDSSWLTLEEKRHVLDGMGEACAYRFSKIPGDTRYCKKAVKYFERAQALRMPPEPTEIILRLRKLPLLYASYGILDLIIGADGKAVEELKRLARLAGSVRAAQQTDRLEAELKRKKIIKS